MKVYLSGPMSGLPEHNYPAFAKAAADLRALGIEVVSPHELDHLLAEGASWEAYMRNDLKALMDCTHLVLLPGWEDSRGAHLEVHLAHRLGVTVRMLEDMLPQVFKPAVEELLAKAEAERDALAARVQDYLNRNGLCGSPLREAEIAEVTREMIGAAHDVMLKKGDFVLSANLLERIYLAMDAKRHNAK